MSKFNDIFNRFIFESTEAEQLASDLRLAVQTNNEFYVNYLAKASIDNEVVAVKARFDTFQVYGYVKNIVKFLKALKVDKKYLENPDTFELFNPMVCLVDSKVFFHQMNDPMNEQYFTAGNYVLTREDIINLTHREIGGTWKTLTTKDDPEAIKQIRSVTPAEFADIMSEYSDGDTMAIIEFTINSKHLPNSVWEEDSYYWSGKDAVEDVNANQELKGHKPMVPQADDDYQNKSLAEKEVNFDKINKVNITKIKAE